MSLADDLASRSVRKGPPCQMGVYVAGLSETDRAEFQGALDAEAVQHSVLSDYLAERGVRLPPETVSRHRRGKCQCDPR